jgi:hypothetical protein
MPSSPDRENPGVSAFRRDSRDGVSAASDSALARIAGNSMDGNPRTLTDDELASLLEDLW